MLSSNYLFFVEVETTAEHLIANLDVSNREELFRRDGGLAK
jgi:hypothetical protein